MMTIKQEINNKYLNNISEDLLIYILGFLDIDEIKILMNIDNFFNNFIDFNEISVTPLAANTFLRNVPEKTIIKCI